MGKKKSKTGAHLASMNVGSRGTKRPEPTSDDGGVSDYSAAEQSGSSEDEVINEESVPRGEDVEKRRRQIRESVQQPTGDPAEADEYEQLGPKIFASGGQWLAEKCSWVCCWVLMNVDFCTFSVGLPRGWWASPGSKVDKKNLLQKWRDLGELIPTVSVSQIVTRRKYFILKKRL